MVQRAALSLLCLFAVAGCTAQVMPPVSIAPQAEPRAPVTILVSIDGFRADYLHRGNSPNLDALADTGLSGSLQPSFPSVTFPNHYTLVTGLRPDQHGIVANTMVDPQRPEVTFRLGDQKLLDDPFWWDEAEPIWVTAEKQGVRSATMFWPGSTAPIHGVRPTDWQAYAQAMPSAQRVRTVIDWLRRPADSRPRFITLYFDEVDSRGHDAGPDAAETAQAVNHVDTALGALRDALKTLGQPANLVIVADHGMAQISRERIVDLDALLPREAYRVIYGGPFTTINPTPGKEAQVAQALVGRHGHMDCWRKADVPARFHYGRNPRVAAIICLADGGWQIVQTEPSRDGKGAHGFDPEAADMAAVFIANGPAFPAHRALSKTDNVNVYPLLAKLIGITPQPNEGDPSALAALAAP